MFVSGVHRGVVPPPSGIITEGLIHHWDMDEGSGTVANDKVGGKHASFVGSPVWVTGLGGVRWALDFNGSSDRLSIGETLNIGALYSFTGAIYAREVGGKTIIGVNANDRTTAVTITRMYHRINAVNGILNLNQGEIHNSWLRFAIIRNGGRADIYSDGVLGVPSDGVLGATDPFLVASIAANTNMGGAFDGMMQDLRIYDRELTVQEAIDITTGNG